MTIELADPPPVVSSPNDLVLLADLLIGAVPSTVLISQRHVADAFVETIVAEAASEDQEDRTP